MEKESLIQPKIEVTRYTDPLTNQELAKAQVTVGKHFLSVIPDGSGDYDVVVFGINSNGNVNYKKELFSIKEMGATADDVEEIADMYLRRLQSGVPPQDLDKDVREKRDAELKEDEAKFMEELRTRSQHG